MIAVDRARQAALTGRIVAASAQPDGRWHRAAPGLADRRDRQDERDPRHPRRLEPLYHWSADVLELWELRALVDRGRGVPTYAWDPADAEAWHPAPSVLARLAQRASGTPHRRHS